LTKRKKNQTKKKAPLPNYKKQATQKKIYNNYWIQISNNKTIQYIQTLRKLTLKDIILLDLICFCFCFFAGSFKISNKIKNFHFFSDFFVLFFYYYSILFWKILNWYISWTLSSMLHYLNDQIENMILKKPKIKLWSFSNYDGSIWKFENIK